MNLYESYCDMGFISNAEDLASVVLDQAMQASDQGTFAVGGCIVENSTGKLVHVIHNNVFKPLKSGESFVYDYTAHGEYQLVEWYFKHKSLLSLPEPSDLTVVTTLDPCIMCTGALLESGFNVGVIALDSDAGVNYDKQFTFSSLPDSLSDLARQRFGYYACGNECNPMRYRRENYVGSKKVAFCDSKITGRSFMGCQEIFLSSLSEVRIKFINSDHNLVRHRDPASLPENSLIKLKFREIFSDAFKIQIFQPGFPDHIVYDLLKRTLLSKEEHGAKNAVALLDGFGNVVLCLADDFESAPTHTAFSNVVQAYSILLFELMDNTETKHLAQSYLGSIRDVTFVFLYAPSPDEATTIMDLGIYGSSIGVPLPKAFPASLQYFHPPRLGGMRQLFQNIIQLPPLYRNIGISFVPVAL